ncbi:MAG: type II toxin-antitoxin system Phd/YefM family antitoxin [Limnohabitans sp.]
MAIHNVSNRDFTHDVTAAKRAALDGPVFITEKGGPAYVLMKIDDYRMMVNGNSSLLDVMDNIPGGEGIDFSAPQLSIAVQEVDWN